jgi:hypothetical protein
MIENRTMKRKAGKSRAPTGLIQQTFENERLNILLSQTPRRVNEVTPNLGFTKLFKHYYILRDSKETRYLANYYKK